MRKLALVTLLAVSACSGQKPDVSDDFTDLASLDDKSDAFSKKMKIVGSLDYGQTSDPVKYTSSPTYRAFKFGGAKGDAVEIDVKSHNGDAVTWLLDNSFKVVAKNDDFGGSTDSHIAAKLPGNTNPSIITYYIVFRDYDYSNATFTVSLKGPAKDFFACKVDSDCVAVSKGGCCPNGINVAVNTSSVDAYKASVMCTQNPHPICPLAFILDQRVAQCNIGAGKCEMVNPEDIRCGGFTTNPHKCSAGYHCDFTGVVPDVPGHCKACVQNQACIQGSHWDTDSCSCVPDVTDCRTTGCAAGRYCSFCWGNFACIPNGALC